VAQVTAAGVPAPEAPPNPVPSNPLPSKAHRLRRARSRVPVWHVVWMLLVAVVFIVPIYSIVQFSLSGTVKGQPLLHWYFTVFDDPDFRSAFWLSLQIALETVAIGLVLVTPTVFWIHLRLPRLRPVMDLISILPFVVPPIVLIVGLAVFLRPFKWLIVRPEVLSLIYVVFALPFLYRALDAGLRALDLKTLVEAGQSLGSSTFRILVQVVVPNLRAAMIGGALLTVSIAMGEFTISSLLGFKTFSVYMYNIGTTTAYEGVALAFISLVITWGAMLSLLFIGRGGRGSTQLAMTK
jgi:putative spermidine/putrescine transport system permease protein